MIVKDLKCAAYLMKWMGRYGKGNAGSEHECMWEVYMRQDWKCEDKEDGTANKNGEQSKTSEAE